MQRADHELFHAVDGDAVVRCSVAMLATLARKVELVRPAPVLENVQLTQLWDPRQERFVAERRVVLRRPAILHLLVVLAEGWMKQSVRQAFAGAAPHQCREVLPLIDARVVVGLVLPRPHGGC